MRQTILDHVTFGRFTATLPDILGSLDIGMLFVSARVTPKVRLIMAVALVTVATLRARPAGWWRSGRPDLPQRLGANAVTADAWLAHSYPFDVAVPKL